MFFPVLSLENVKNLLKFLSSKFHNNKNGQIFFRLF